MLHPLSNLLLQTFNKLEDRLQTYAPTKKLHITALLSRGYNGDVILTYHIGESFSDYGGSVCVKGKDPEACLAEALRRLGFQAEQESLLLEPPVEPNGPQADPGYEPVALDLSDEIPF